MQCQNCYVENTAGAARCAGCNLALDEATHQELALVNRMLRTFTQNAPGKKPGAKVVETYAKRRQQLLDKLLPADGSPVKIQPPGGDTSVEIPTMKLQETEESTRSLITTGGDTIKLPPSAVDNVEDTQTGNLLGASTDELTARTRQLEGAADVTRKLSGDDISELVADAMHDDLPLASTVRVSDTAALDTQGLESARREAMSEPPPETGNLEATVKQLHRPQPLGARASGEKKDRPETRAAGIYLQKQVARMSHGAQAGDTVPMQAADETLPLGGIGHREGGTPLPGITSVAVGVLAFAGVPALAFGVSWTLGSTVGALAGVAIAGMALFTGLRQRARWASGRIDCMQLIAAYAGMVSGLALSVTRAPMPLAYGVTAGALLGAAISLIGCLVHRRPLQLAALVFFACLGLHAALAPTLQALLEVGYWLPAVYAVLMLGLGIASRGVLDKDWLFAAMSGLQSALALFMAQFMFFWLVTGDFSGLPVLLVVLCNAGAMTLAACVTRRKLPGFWAAVAALLCEMTLLGGVGHETRMAVGAGLVCAGLFAVVLYARRAGWRELAAGVSIGAATGVIFIACMLGAHS